MTEADIQQIAQLTLDLEGLQRYFHVDVAPDRKPLRVLRNEAVSQEPRLVKFGEPVTYVSAPDAQKEKKPYFEFTKLEARGDTAQVEFSYPVEGIRGWASFRRVDGAWTLEGKSLTER